ncbi:MAG: hypothetical protein E7448_08610 [Ruminococcaceae bacterium]|nr:hypothetical protein [Oscillospiraceae bacterium]
MDEIIEKIEQANWEELQILMKAIQDRNAVIFPDWSVTYMAVHKEYKNRRRDTNFIIKMLKQELRQSKKTSKKRTPSSEGVLF